MEETFESFSNKTGLQKPAEREKRSWKSRSGNDQAKSRDSRSWWLSDPRLVTQLPTSAGTRWYFMCFCPVKCQRGPGSRPTAPLNPEKRSEQGRALGGETSLACQTAWIPPLGYGNVSLTRVGAEQRGCGDITRHRAARRVSAEASRESEEEKICCLHSSAHAVNVEHQERSRKELRVLSLISLPQNMIS